MTSTAIAFLERFYKVSFVKCLFVGGDQKVRSSHDVGLRPSDPIKVADVINQASLARFGVALDLSNATTYITTASTLAPMQACALDNAIKVEEYEPEPDKELPVLWLRVELSNRLIANARAKAAGMQYEALKTRSKLDGIEFSDAEFAKLLGKKGAALCVALGHGKTTQTPANGHLVAEIEKLVGTYTDDLVQFERDLKRIRDEARVLREGTAVRAPHPVKLRTASEERTALPAHVRAGHPCRAGCRDWPRESLRLCGDGLPPRLPRQVGQGLRRPRAACAAPQRHPQDRRDRGADRRIVVDREEGRDEAEEDGNSAQ